MKLVPVKSQANAFFYGSLALGVFSILLILITKSLLPPLVPLFYGKPAGESQLVPTLALLIAPAVSILITLINTLLASFTKEDFLKKILTVSSFFVSLLISLTVFKIIFLVGFF